MATKTRETIRDEAVQQRLDHDHPILFDTGRQRITPAAVAASIDEDIDLAALVDRHRRGDAGAITKQQRNRDLVALISHGRYVSSFYARPTGGGTIFIIETDIGKRRTVISLENEYQPAPLPEEIDPEILRLRDEEDRLLAARAALDLSATRAEHRTARIAEQNAEAAFTQALLASGPADEVAAAEAELRTVRATLQSLALKTEAFDKQAAALDREITEVRAARTQRQRDVVLAAARRHDQLLSLSAWQERDAREIAALAGQRASLLRRITERGRDLAALGAHPNPAYDGVGNTTLWLPPPPE